MASGGIAEWEFGWTMFRNATVASEADTLMAALACTTDHKLLKRCVCVCVCVCRDVALCGTVYRIDCVCKSMCVFVCVWVGGKGYRALQIMQVIAGCDECGGLPQVPALQPGSRADP